MAETWWAVARSEEVTSSKPISVDIGDQPVVLDLHPLEEQPGQIRRPILLVEPVNRNS